ncbi:hypothetical protein ACU4GH_31535 [Bradyrhizobium betae]
MLLFLGEAAVLAAIGGMAGLLLGWGIAQVLTAALPALPVHTPWSYASAGRVAGGGDWSGCRGAAGTKRGTACPAGGLAGSE